jgi:outer membrane protein
LLNIKAQHANNVNTLATARNSTAQFLLQLKQFLRIPYVVSFVPMSESLSSTEDHLDYLDKLNPVALMDTLLSKRPDLKAAQYRKSAAMESISIAKGALAPTLSIGANLNTVYSDNAKRITGYTINGSQAIGWLPSTMEAVYAPVLEYNTETIAFSKQLKDNFGQSIGLNLSIPIYAGLRGHNQVSAATIAYKRAELTRLQIVQNAENEINQAILAYKNARNRVVSASSNLVLQQENRDYVKARFSEGAATAVELQIAESNYTNANFNFISAQHDLYFRAFVLDFYLSVIQ